jgi:hypothetical protein
MIFTAGQLWHTVWWDIFLWWELCFRQPARWHARCAVCGQWCSVDDAWILAHWGPWEDVTSCPYVCRRCFWGYVADGVLWPSVAWVPAVV